MRTKIFLFSLLLIFCELATSQIVTTTPEFPVPTLPVTITFDATTTDLVGYTGDLYAHTGVYLVGGTTWQHVIGSWGNNTNQPKLTRTATDIYTLTITPSINTFYNISVSETVRQMNFVFRNADGSKQSPDIFVDVFSDPQAVLFSSPDTTGIYSIGDEIEIDAVSLFANNLNLYVNDILVANSTSNSINNLYTINLAGFNEIKVVATDGAQTVKDSIFFFVRNQNNVLELPSANLQDGINYIDATTVTLVLYAPFKEFVFVKGSFNNWTFSDESQMNITPDSKRYWITLTELVPGQEYSYQYVIDGNLYVADSYSDKILDPWNDSYIPATTYPNLIPYPSGKATGIVSVFQTNQTDYQWTTTNFQRPSNTDLVVYELHIRDFIAKHDYKTLIDTIGYLKNLGINAIELMPINEFEGNNSWGYNPSFYFAPDKYYGTKNDLKEFIDVCHQNGIAVILDMVLNHAYGQCPMVQMYFDPNAGEWGQPAANNPWFNPTSPNPVYSWGSDFNHQSTDTKKFVSRVVKYWLTDYKFDGFRFDFTKGFTNTLGEGWAYDASRIQTLKNIADTIWETSPNTYVILEHLTDNSEEKVLANYGIMLWGNINHAYCEASMGYADGDSDFSWISYNNRGWNNPNLVGYMESHDEERQMFKNITYGNSNGSYNIKELNTALKRAELTSVFFFTIPGPKMIWEFGELGYDISIDDPCRVCDKPILWNYYQNEARYRLYKFYETMIKLKISEDVFETEAFSLTTSGAVKHVVLESTDLDVVIIGNFDVKIQDGEPKFTKTGTWYDYFSGEEITNTDTILSLQPGEYKIYTSSQLEIPNLPAYPEAKNVTITGSPIVGATLKGEYTFFDLNGDTEAQSTFKWYRADNSNGTNKVEITGSISKTYTITADDIDKYISFAVTPVTSSSTYTIGQSAESPLLGAVTVVSDSISIVPNPSEAEFTFMGIQNYTLITIRDLTGKVIRTFPLTGEAIKTVNLSDLEQGVYIVKFSNETEYISKRIMKMKL